MRAGPIALAASATALVAGCSAFSYDTSGVADGLKGDIQFVVDRRLDRQWEVARAACDQIDGRFPQKGDRFRCRLVADGIGIGYRVVVTCEHHDVREPGGEEGFNYLAVASNGPLPRVTGHVGTVNRCGGPATGTIGRLESRARSHP